MACALAITPAIAAGPWYVATNGADSGRDGLSWDQAFLTISNAVAVADTGTINVSNGVYVLSAQITVAKPLTVTGVNGWTNTIVDGNLSVRCFQLNHASAVLRGLTIRNGYAAESGAGVRLLKGTLDNCLVFTNTAGARGGGIHLGWSSDLSGGAGAITNCRVYNNTARSGGGLSLYGGGGNSYSIIIDNCDISSNRSVGAEFGGAGIWFQGNTLKVRNSRIADNMILGTAGASGRGAGFNIGKPNNSVLIENCEITGNVLSNNSITYGGGFYIAGSNTVMRNCLIASNKAYCANYAFLGLGGGIYFADANQTGNVVECCTIVGNNSDFIHWGGQPAKIGGSGIYLTGNGSDIFRNCIVYNNTGLADWYLGDDARTNNVYFTCTTNRMGGIGNTTNTPQFINAAAGNYRLGPRSPCLNFGTNVSWMTNTWDLAGEIRVRYGAVDMGAYEAVYDGTIYKFH